MSFCMAALNRKALTMRRLRRVWCYVRYTHQPESWLPTLCCVFVCWH